MRTLLEFIAKHIHWFVFALLEIICGVMLFRHNAYQGSVWFTTANAVVGKIYECNAALKSFFSLTTVNQQLTDRNIRLEQQLAELSHKYAELTRDSSDLERAGQQLLNRYKLIEAKVIDNTLDRTYNLMTIDKGRADGVHTDMGVACGMGVVGIVCMASDHYAVVMPVLNAKTRISCTIRGRGYFGYLNWTGGDPTLAYVEDIPRHARFYRGDIIETSGYSTMFPQGVPVGRIEKVYNSRDGLSYRLLVRLSTDFSTVRDVAVIADSTANERLRLLDTARDSLGISRTQ